MKFEWTWRERNDEKEDNGGRSTNCFVWVVHGGSKVTPGMSVGYVSDCGLWIPPQLLGADAADRDYPDAYI